MAALRSLSASDPDGIGLQEAQFKILERAHLIDPTPEFSPFQRVIRRFHTEQQRLHDIRVSKKSHVPRADELLPEPLPVEQPDPFLMEPPTKRQKTEEKPPEPAKEVTRPAEKPKPEVTLTPIKQKEPSTQRARNEVTPKQPKAQKPETAA